MRTSSRLLVSFHDFFPLTSPDLRILFDLPGGEAAKASEGPNWSCQVPAGDDIREWAEGERGRQVGRIQAVLPKGASSVISQFTCPPSHRLTASSSCALQVRSTGESPSKEDIIRVAKLFESDVTLDNLSRPQLVSMCRYMKIHAFGTDNFLRHQIRSRLEKIRADDKVILGEGVNTLSVSELQNACQSRGIRFTGVSPSTLRKELDNWIELHYTNKVSGVLLVLSRAFHFNEEHADVVKSLEVTLSSLPDKLVRSFLDILSHPTKTRLLT